MMWQHRGSVLLAALFFVALASLVMTHLLLHHQFGILLLRQKINYSIAFQKAEEGLYLAYQHLPQIGIWHQSSLIYQVALLAQDRCQNKTFRLDSNAEVQHTKVHLMAVVIKPYAEGCTLPTYRWRWQQVDFST